MLATTVWQPPAISDPPTGDHAPPIIYRPPYNFPSQGRSAEKLPYIFRGWKARTNPLFGYSPRSCCA
jgi:hypothetical protein